MSDDCREYLERRHAAFQTPEALVFQLVARATGHRPVSRRKLALGNDNEVYLVADSTGEEYVARIHRGGEVDLKTEAWVIEQYKRAGVPVPQVYVVDREEYMGEKLEYMVQGRCPGRPLSDIDREQISAEWAGICRQAGKVLGKMHSVEVDGFYHLNPDGSWDFPDWRAVMDSTVRGRGSEQEWIVRAGFSEDEFSCMMRLIERYRDEFSCAQPVLCHGDYLPEHIFVDDSLRICGVIDFGMYRGDHPIHDFAALSTAGTGMQIRQVLKGYPQSSFASDRFDMRLHLHRLTLEMGYLAHHMRIEHYPEIDLNRRGLRHTLQHPRHLGCVEGP
jgi:aminoglycoside phosphotransferase (APT) family kinase protein